MPTTETYPKLASLIDYLESLSGRADLSVLQELLSQAEVTREDLAAACNFGTKAYKRNTISKGNWHELLAVCWRSGHCTPIHNHASSSCAFRVIEGIGTEIRFEQTPSGLVCPIKTTQMAQGYICAADDDDIHQVANMQASGTDLVTLHIYSPALTSIKTWKFAQPSVEGIEELGAAALYDGMGD